MFQTIKETITVELDELLKVPNMRPYVFRTRLERVLMRTSAFAKQQSRQDVLSTISEIKDKLKYVSDQSNQTSDGTLKSFVFLEKELNSLYVKMIS